MKVTRDNLNDFMRFERVIWVHEDGSVTDAPKGVYAPDVYENFSGKTVAEGDWTLLSGYSGQYCYSGPVMHPSEYIGGRLADAILAQPGYYVALVITEDSDDRPAVGWAIAYREVRTAMKDSTYGGTQSAKFVVTLKHGNRPTVQRSLWALSARDAVATVLDTERAPIDAVRSAQVWPPCDYCDVDMAELYARDGANTPYCRRCAYDHFGTTTDVRAATGKLGIRTLPHVDRSEWAPAKKEEAMPDYRYHVGSNVPGYLSDSAPTCCLNWEDASATLSEALDHYSDSLWCDHPGEMMKPGCPECQAYGAARRIMGELSDMGKAPMELGSRSHGHEWSVTIKDACPLPVVYWICRFDASEFDNHAHCNME